MRRMPRQGEWKWNRSKLPIMLHNYKLAINFSCTLICSIKKELQETNAKRHDFFDDRYLCDKMWCDTSNIHMKQKLNNISQKSAAFKDENWQRIKGEDTWLALPSMAMKHSEKAKTAIFKMEATKNWESHCWSVVTVTRFLLGLQFQWNKRKPNIINRYCLMDQSHIIRTKS